MNIKIVGGGGGGCTELFDWPMGRKWRERKTAHTHAKQEGLLTGKSKTSVLNKQKNPAVLAFSYVRFTLLFDC